MLVFLALLDAFLVLINKLSCVCVCVFFNIMQMTGHSVLPRHVKVVNLRWVSLSNDIRVYFPSKHVCIFPQNTCVFSLKTRVYFPLQNWRYKIGMSSEDVGEGGGVGVKGVYPVSYAINNGKMHY